MSNTSNTDLLQVVITEKQVLTEDIIALTLAMTDGSDLPKFTAGAHIEVHVPNAEGDNDIVRQYSLCNDPSESKFYRLGILKDPNSRGGSVAIHDTFQVGDTITISKPKNLFPLEMTAGHSLLVGGGIGITPMIAMAYQLQAEGKSFDIHYSAKSVEQASFVEELQAHFASELKLHLSALGKEHRLNPTADFANVDSQDTHIYVCGPENFMNSVIDSAKQLGFAEEHIHFEYFNFDVDTSGESFTIIAEQSDKTIEVAGDESIVDALAKVGIKVDVSCEQGICGTCIVDVIEGEPDHRDQFLTDDEKADNDQIAVCCSRAKSATLTLDI